MQKIKETKEKCIENLEQARAEKRIISLVFGIVAGIFSYIMIKAGQNNRQDFVIPAYFCMMTNIYAFLPVYHVKKREIHQLLLNLQELEMIEKRWEN